MVSGLCITLTGVRNTVFWSEYYGNWKTIIMEVGTDAVNTVIRYKTSMYISEERSFNLKLLKHYTGEWASIILRLMTCCSQGHSFSSDAFVKLDCNRAVRTHIAARGPLRLPSSIFQLRRDIRSCSYAALETRSSSTVAAEVVQVQNKYT